MKFGIFYEHQLPPKERDAVQCAAKQERLGEALEAALGRREPARPAPDDYVVPASGQA